MRSLEKLFRFIFHHVVFSLIKLVTTNGHCFFVSVSALCLGEKSSKQTYVDTLKWPTLYYSFIGTDMSAAKIARTVGYLVCIQMLVGAERQALISTQTVT